MAREFVRPPSSPLVTDADHAVQQQYFRDHPELTPTPLRRLPALARRLGIADLLVKDETARFGLPAFKSVGAFFAVSTLISQGRIRAGDTLACASEGNHGRAVARAARQNQCMAVVYAASDIADARASAIEAEGARIVRVVGGYDAAVHQMNDDARREGWVVISDTAGEGDDYDTPRLIMLGYTRIMDEAEASWAPEPPPDFIFVPAGVGGLLAAVGSWVDWRYGHGGPRVVCVEPTSAACVLAAWQAGRPVVLTTPIDTILAGLRCAEVSHAAFDTIVQTVRTYLPIEDHWAIEAMRRLREPAESDPQILAGASGAAGLGGLLKVVGDEEVAERREFLGLTPASRVLLIVTEGTTESSHERTLST